jgi:Alcohol dehydrogenase transcription factor Myb/SANT-like/Zinc-finger associated domain (zf-AD)
MSWPLQKTKRFLKILEKLPVIWDENHPKHRCDASRAKNFTVLAKLMDHPDVDEVMANKRYRCIRNAVLKQLRSIQHLNEAERAVEMQKDFYPEAHFFTDMYRTKYKNDFTLLTAPSEKEIMQAVKSVAPRKNYSTKNSTKSNHEEVGGKKLPFEWTVEHSRCLFSFVEPHPGIWNKKDENYANKDYRNNTFKLIAKQMGVEGLERLIRRKYENLRDTVFRKVRTKQATEFNKSYYPAAWFLIESYAEKHPNQISKTKKAFEWDTPHSAKLLSLIERFPCIWDENHHYYRSMSVRAASMKRICDGMNMPGYDTAKLSNKYASIRARILKKIRMHQQGNADERAQVEKELQLGFYPAADFLFKHLSQKKISGQIETTGQVAKVKRPAPKITRYTCRICLSPSDGSFKSIVKPADAASSELSLDEIIQFTTGYIVTSERPFYPASLCEQCGQELLSSYEFKMKCERTEGFLEQLYGCQDQQAADKLYESRFGNFKVQKQPKREIKDPVEEVEFDINTFKNIEAVEIIEMESFYDEVVVKSEYNPLDPPASDPQPINYKFGGEIEAETVEEDEKCSPREQLQIPEFQMNVDQSEDPAHSKDDNSEEEIEPEMVEEDTKCSPLEQFPILEIQINVDKIEDPARAHSNDDDSEEEVEPEMVEDGPSCSPPAPVQVPPPKVQANDAETKFDIDPEVLEQQITEQLQALEGCSTIANFREPRELLKTTCEICGKVMHPASK